MLSRGDFIGAFLKGKKICGLLMHKKTKNYYLAIFGATLSVTKIFKQKSTFFILLLKGLDHTFTN